MDNSFIPKAIDMVKDAIAADTNQEYEIALGLYKKSLEYFMTGLKYEPNPVSASEARLFFFTTPFGVLFFFCLVFANCENRRCVRREHVRTRTSKIV